MECLNSFGWVKSLADFLLRQDQEELFLNGFNKVFCSDCGTQASWDSPFGNAQEYRNELQRFVFANGLRLDPNHPFASGFLDLNAGYRWQAVLSTVSPDGSLFCLRRHRFSGLDLGSFGLSSLQQQQLSVAVSMNHPILVFGSTGSGKTSFLSAVMGAFLKKERLIILESSQELQLLASNWIRLQEKPMGIDGKGHIGMDTLIEQSLRLRPDRLVLAEVRGKEILGLMQALMCGHKGTLLTIHAGTICEVWDRLSLLSNMYLGYAIDWKKYLSKACFVEMQDKRVKAVTFKKKGSQLAA